MESTGKERARSSIEAGERTQKSNEELVTGEWGMTREQLLEEELERVRIQRDRYKAEAAEALRALAQMRIERQNLLDDLDRTAR